MAPTAPRCCGSSRRSRFEGSDRATSLCSVDQADLLPHLLPLFLRGAGCDFGPGGGATIVGHSFGGGIAMQFAYQHPDIAERLVLVSSGGLGDEVSWLLRTLSAPGVEHLLGLATLPLVRNAADRTGTLLTKVGLQPSEQANEIHNAYTSLASAEARSALVHTIRSVIDLQGQRVSASDRIHVAGDLPTLIVWGSRDRIIPVTHAHDAHELIPGSRLELFEQAGHFPHTEEPARFGAALEEHLTRPLPVGSAQSQKQYRPR